VEETDRKFFHTVVAKLLYLGKRIRPDILLTVSFLCTRVTKVTERDMIKLKRLVNYVACIKDVSYQTVLWTRLMESIWMLRATPGLL
jgi:hypothetical protein